MALSLIADCEAELALRLSRSGFAIGVSTLLASCCEMATRRRCQVSASQCVDDLRGSDLCWPVEVGWTAARFLGLCCPKERAELLSAARQIPSWMFKEIAEDFAVWEGIRVTRERLDVAERQYGDQLCRLTIRNNVLHIGNTPGCRSDGRGPLVVQDISGAVEVLMGAGMLSRDLDFLVLSADFSTELPSDVPVFVHGAARCQVGRGVILLPTNDCVSGLVDQFHRDLSKRVKEAALSPPLLADPRLVWRGTVRWTVACSPRTASTCSCKVQKAAKNSSDLRRFARFRLMEISQRLPGIVDAKGRCAEACKNAPAPPWLSKGHVDAPGFDWSNYLFHASVDADAYNTLANWRPLLLGRILVKQSTEIAIAWFRHGLRPHVHYLPIRGDFFDIQSRLTWAAEHSNETERIRRNGFRFARSYVARCQLYSRLHVKAALESYARLQA